MIAAETIQAAIDKLTNLRDAACGPEPWEASPEGVTSAGLPVAELEGGGCAYWSDGDRDLVVTLHATIDAQLVLLCHTLEFYRGDLGIGMNRHVVNLAHAILGEQVDA